MTESQIVTDDDFARAMKKVCRCGNEKGESSLLCPACTTELASKQETQKEAWARGDNPWRPRAVDR